MKRFEKDYQTAVDIARRVSERSGTAFFVGGFVRDRLLDTDGTDIENKDIDIEVHGISPDELEQILGQVGQMMTIGESFGIYGLKGSSIDIAMPRREVCLGRGHRDFRVEVDPFIGTEAAARRRDLTVNAIMQDILTGEIVDHFGGKKDLQNKVIRHVNDGTFAEDPLRVLRAAQFAARLGFTVADETIALCRGIRLDSLSRERVEGELRKALLKSEKPSVFFEALRSMDRLSEWFPEVQRLIGTAQNINYHKEGDVWTHTMMVLDAAAGYRSEVSEPFAFMLSALAHDFGKPASTTVVDGVTHSHGHEALGAEPAAEFMKRLVGEKKFRRYVLNMVQNHMKPNVSARRGSSLKSTNKMFDGSVAPRDLIYLAMSDGGGKIPRDTVEENAEFLFARLEAYNEIMSRPYVTGDDLIKAGLEPDDDFSEILEYAHKLRLAGIDKQSALKQALSYARKLGKRK